MSNQNQVFVQNLVNDFVQHLGIPAPSPETFDIGFLYPSDVPERVTVFFKQNDLTLDGEKVVSYKAFQKVFKEKPLEPKQPTKADFLAEAIRKFPDVPLDHLNEIERQRNYWIEGQIRQASAEYEIDIISFKKREEKRNSFIDDYEDSPSGYMQYLKDHYPPIAVFFQSKNSRLHQRRQSQETHIYCGTIW